MGSLFSCGKSALPVVETIENWDRAGDMAAQIAKQVYQKSWENISTQYDSNKEQGPVDGTCTTVKPNYEPIRHPKRMYEYLQHAGVCYDTVIHIQIAALYQCAIGIP